VTMQRPETQVGEHLDGVRKRIDPLDEALVRLLNARAACALEIGRARGQLDWGLSEPTWGLGDMRRVNRGPLDDQAIRRLFEKVNDEASHLARRSAAAVTTG
jgi:chorismate mutase